MGGVVGRARDGGRAGKDGVVVAQRESARETLSPVKSRAKNETKGKGADKDKSGERTPRASLSVETERRIVAELAVPPPTSEATRALLSGYVAQLDKTLRRR